MSDWESVEFPIPWADNNGRRPSIVRAMRRGYHGQPEEVVLEYDKYINSTQPGGPGHRRVTEIKKWNEVSG